MKKINFIDFDGTLYNGDSLFKFIILLLMYSDARVQIIFAAIKKVLRVIDGEIFLDDIYKVYFRTNKMMNHLDDFIDRILENLNDDVICEVMNHTDNETINVICTASPDIYMTKIAYRLGYECLCSYSEHGKVVRMFGDKKTETINKIYSKDNYTYNFAISDNITDLKLMKQFSTYKLIK